MKAPRRIGSLVQRMSSAFRVGHLAGDAAHDLNNHLQVMLGNAELLGATENLPESARRRLARIVDAGRRASAGNDALLALARDAAGDERTAAADHDGTTLGDLMHSRRPALARLLRTGTTLELDVEASLDTLPANAVAGHSALPHLAAALVLHARPTLPPGGEATLHVRSVDDASLHLYLASRERPADGSRIGARTDASADASHATAATLVVDILASLARDAGGRIVPDGADGSRSGPLVVLPLETAQRRSTSPENT